MIKSSLRCTPLLLIPMLACAQLQVQAPPVGFNGTLVSYGDESVTLQDKDGKEATVAMTRGWTVSRPRTVEAAGIKPGAFVASANTPVDEHTGRSVELRIMEPGYRPETGTHLMAGQQNRAMTHGDVTAVRQTAAGVELDVTYPGGSRHLVVPPDVKVTDFQLLDRSVLKPGTQVGAVARKGDDGVLRAGRLTLPAQ